MKVNYNNINKKIVSELISDNHSLKNNSAIPYELEDGKFLQNLFFNRYAKLYKECIRVTHVKDVNRQTAMMGSTLMLNKIINIESQHAEKLEQLAIKIVKDYFNLTDELDMNAKLTTEFEMGGIQKEPDMKAKIELDSYEDVLKMKDEINKRRLINALIQGGANSLNSIFYLYKDELNDIDHRLFSYYSILIPNAEIMYYFNQIDGGESAGGKCEIDLPEDPNAAPMIIASSICFPVLVQELSKGVLETISLQGLPEDKEYARFILKRADYYSAEGWDMLLGIPFWENILEIIPLDDQNLKHQIFFEIVKLDVDSFNEIVPEILSKSNRGKEYIIDMIKDIKHDIKLDNISDTLYDLDNDDLDYGDLSDLDLRF